MTDYERMVASQKTASGWHIINAERSTCRNCGCELKSLRLTVGPLACYPHSKVFCFQTNVPTEFAAPFPFNPCKRMDG